MRDCGTLYAKAVMVPLVMKLVRFASLHKTSGSKLPGIRAATASTEL